MKLNDIVQAITNHNKILHFAGAARKQYQLCFGEDAKYNFRDSKELTASLLESGWTLEGVHYLYNTRMYCDQPHNIYTTFAGKKLLIII